MTEYNINSQWTLLERAKRSADGKRILPILDVMDKLGVEDFLKDWPYFPANQGLKHRIVRTTSRPSSTRRSFYQGVGATKLGTQVIYEPVVLFEQRSEIDEDELDTVENANEARRQEDEGHIGGLLDDFVYAIFRDARTSGSEYIDGLAARLASLSYPGYTTTDLPFVWDNGGSGSDLCSMYIVDLGARANHGIFPSGSAVRGGAFGIIARNKGKEPKADTDDSTHTYYAYVSQFKKWAGVACHDDRRLTRIANIERDETSAKALNENNIIKALNHGRFDRRTTRMYCNPYLKSQIDIKAKDKSNIQWSIVDVFGKPVPAFWGIPIRVLDETILSGSESAVS